MLQFIDQLRINKTCKNRLWLNLRLQIVHKSIFLIRKKKLYFSIIDVMNYCMHMLGKIYIRSKVFESINMKYERQNY